MNISVMCLLTLDSSYARKHFTLDGLEQGATAGRDIAHLVGETELVDTSHRVATADQREGTLGRSLGDCLTDGT